MHLNLGGRSASTSQHDEEEKNMESPRPEEVRPVEGVSTALRGRLYREARESATNHIAKTSPPGNQSKFTRKFIPSPPVLRKPRSEGQKCTSAAERARVSLGGIKLERIIPSVVESESESKEHNINQKVKTNKRKPSKQEIETDSILLEKLKVNRVKSNFMSFTERLAKDHRFILLLRDPSSFLYLEKVKDGHPYELCIVDNTSSVTDNEERNYYTWSSSGVTHYNGDSREFCSIAQFEREYFLFSKISQFPVFKKHKLWKVYSTWKTSVRSKKIEERKAKLQERLFMLHPLLCKSLLSLRSLCWNVSEYRLFKIDQGKTYDLDEFCETQKNQKIFVSNELENFALSVRKLLLQSCNTALESFLETNGFSKGFKGNELKDKPKAITFTERAAMRTQCRKLTKFIRLGDFFVIDTFFSIAATSTQVLLNQIKARKSTSPAVEKLLKYYGEKIRNDENVQMVSTEEELALLSSISKTVESKLYENESDILDHAKSATAKKHIENAFPLFSVEMQFEPSSMCHDLRFFPTAEDYRIRLEAIIFDTLNVVTDPERLLTHPDFSLYVQASLDDNTGANGDGTELEVMIVEDKTFQQCIQGITSCLREAFDKASVFCSAFLPFMEQYIANEQLSKDLKIAHFYDASLETLKDLLERYTAQQESFIAMPTISDVSIIQIKSEDLKDTFMPSPRICLDKLFELIPEIMRKKCDVVLKDMTLKNEILNKVQYSVEDFVNLMTFLQEVNEVIDSVDQQFDFTNQLYKVCQEYNVPLTDDDNTAIFMLKETNKALHMSIQLTEDSVSEQTVRFAKELEEKIPKVRTEIGGVRTQLGHPIVFSQDSPCQQVIKYLNEVKAEMDKVNKKCEDYMYYQKTLGVAVQRYEELEEIRTDWTMKNKLWTSYEEWLQLSKQWCSTLFSNVDAQSISIKVDQFIKIATTAERSLQGNQLAPMMKDLVVEFKKAVPIVIAFRCEALTERHWDIIHNILGYKVNAVDDLTLGMLVERKAMDYVEKIQTVATEAVQEAVLQQMLQKVIDRWAKSEFEIMQYKESKDFIIGGVDDIISDLDDSLVTINTILGSRFVSPIRASVDEWQEKLTLFQDTLDEILNCQRNWMYLESIFSAPDIQRQLPTESKMFFKVDSSWRDNMKRMSDEPNCVKCCTRQGLKDTLQKHNATLDSIQKSLEDYLETKRAAFPRFYFLSNDELLQILAQSKDPQAVQPHLRKCFDALVALDFGDAPKSIDIKAMISPEGERIELGKNLKARGNVEDWLTVVESNMKISLQKLMKSGLADYFGTSREHWVKQHPGQVVATVAQIAWVIATEAVLGNMYDKHDRAKTLDADSDVSDGEEDGNISQEYSFIADYYGEHIKNMESWYQKNVLDLAKLTELVRSNLTKIERKVIVALVTTDVHARDIIETLNEGNINSLQSFTWQQQLRYYWEGGEVDDCLVRQSNSAIRYAYEYEGCTSRLVITPLTDRCWMTLTGALHLKLGGSPSGPAGTGKTESSKDLAKALGIQCIVFNCSDQIDYKMMGKLFSGLAQSGCWTCLDEFNRIDIEVLSVIAQQLLTLRVGRLAGEEKIIFDERDIFLKDHHVIITMNPGYAGRTELPDNLKVLFRPVAMMVPNYSLIAEIMLFAEGFADAKSLSRKMTKMYMLCSEQLSQQCHYDYGLRAVKSVLVMAGGLKRGSPGVSEDVVLIRAMRDSNLPKFLAQDLPLFFGILTDLFPGVEVPYQDTGTLQTTLIDIMKEQNLQVVDTFLKKIIQLYETMNVRFGITIVGPSGGGKTTAYELLERAKSRLSENGNDEFHKVEKSVLNPKCISMGELYGEFNELTQEWTDGLASSIMREYVADTSPSNKWVIFDGPIDALWIENMNTVLDDNMTLCLANGERLKLKVEMKCIFEVEDLLVASPATVSRLGVVYMTPEGLGWFPYIQTWIKETLTKATYFQSNNKSDDLSVIREVILFTVENVLKPGLEFIRKSCKEPIETSNINIAVSFCRILRSLLPFWENEADNSNNILENAVTKSGAQKLCAYAVIWSLGGAVDSTSKAVFDEWFRSRLERFGLGSMFPGRGTVYDYMVDVEKNEFKPWNVQQFEYKNNVPFFQLVVPTVDTVRHSYIFGKLVDILEACFFTGLTGTGKTVILQSFLRLASQDVEEENENSPSLNDESNEDTKKQQVSLVPLVAINIGFSAQTLAKTTQLTIESKLEKKRKSLLGPPAGKNAVVFVDDVNMPAVEEYGAQPPIELLRQYLDFKGFFDRKKLFWKHIQNTCLAAAAAPPGGGRNPLNKRFLRHFNIFCVPVAGDTEMNLIFSSILGGFLDYGSSASDSFPNDVKMMCKSIVKSTVEIFKRISLEMLPTPKKSHYTFNLRDLSKVIQGILMVRPAHCLETDVMLRLWMHENLRVFHDRLINDEDKNWFKELLLELINRNFKMGWSIEDIFGPDAPAIVFADFLNPGGAVAEPDQGDAHLNGGDDDKNSMSDLISERPYRMSDDIQKVASVLEDAVDEYNLFYPTKMDLVFFRDAAEHVSRISRILRQPRGNAMLVGVGGSGKQSLSRLATFMGGLECLQIELTKGYGQTEFREDLKILMIKTGVEGRKVSFLFTDTQIIEEGFLEDMNNILNSGEVPNLFPQDEMDRIVADMRPVLKRLGIPETRDNCKETFVNRVRDNLHIILCMSPVGNSLRVRCRQFPSLINCCTIDWYLKWPEDALTSVAMKFLSGLELPSEECRRALVDACVAVHTSIPSCAQNFFQELRRYTYTTPKSYLDLIQLYTSMLSEKRSEIKRARNRLSNGVVKLEETNEMVQQLKIELNNLMPVLEVKSKDAEKLLKQVAVEKEDASKVQARVALEEAEVNKQAEKVREVQEDAQRDLDKALPALDSAILALNSLDKKDITEVKNFAKPPPAVQMVMEAVNLLLGEKPDWDTAKKVMGDAKFMENLKNYDKDNIPANTLKKLRKYINDPMMAVENLKKVSKAATSLCMWVHAMDVYSAVAKEVGPKRERLEKMNQELENANKTLRDKQTALQEIVDKVNQLEAKCNETVAEKTELVNEAELSRARLVRAEKLTSGLASEGVRWKETVGELDTQIQLLVGDIFLASACVSYYGAFTGKYREGLISEWLEKVKEMNIPCNEFFSLENVIGNPVTIREWQICGLPTDEVSTNNALLATRGKRWPLMIDPQMQANRWIKQKEAKHSLQITKIDNAELLRILETSIRNGNPLLIEDIEEELDPALEPVLQKATFKQDGRNLIRLGDSDIDYDDKFQLYITTKMSNPHYLPEVCIKVTIINFTVTMDGLEDQLLGTVVLEERPDIEARKNRLLLSMASDKKQLKDIEDKILRMLSESKGVILDDEELINTLADSKTTSAIITERVQESEKTNIEVNEMRNSYRPVAKRGSILYFVIADLANTDPMYQYSLEYFVKLFKKCLKDSEKSDEFNARLQNILDYMTKFIFSNVCRGLFEVHKLLFAFLICTQIMLNSEQISKIEWMMLMGNLTTTLLPEDYEMMENPYPEEISTAAWTKLALMEGMIPDFKGISEHILNNWNTQNSLAKDKELESDDSTWSWKRWAKSEEPQELQLPSSWQENLSSFQRLLLVHAFREEKFIFSARDFVSIELGRGFVQSTATSMEEIHADMDCKTPCIFILSQGADPTGILLRFAEKQKYRERLHVISLGQGQGIKAEQLINKASKTGDWVMLQNCHLAKSWMPRLEGIVQDLQELPTKPGRRPSVSDTGTGIRERRDSATGGNVNARKRRGSLSDNNARRGSLGGEKKGLKYRGVVHQAFRLFLTSFPAAYFPVSVLQSGIKLTNEPPKGLKANIMRSFETVLNPDTIDGCPEKPDEFRKLLFGLCFFHGLIQERRKFGALGWNIRYEFDDSDLETSVEQLKNFLQTQTNIPWDALRYVTGQINYGGRVTDDWDRRCLMYILEKFYSEGILDDEYCFSPSGTYYAPASTNLEGYKQYISTLPIREDPEVFGMHQNANITFQLKESSTLLKAVISLQPRTVSTGSGVTPDEIVENLIGEMVEQMPDQMNVETEKGSSTFIVRDNGLLDSLATFLLQEIEKFNRLLSRVESSMHELLAAIKGTVVMSADLDHMYTSILGNTVPQLWTDLAYPSLKPLGSWVNDLVMRVHFLRQWLQKGAPNVFPLPCFFFPQGFLTGTLQSHARKFGVAINSLSFKFVVFSCEEDEISEAPENGVVVSGLFLEGAHWNRETNSLDHSEPGVMYSELRPVHFLPSSDKSCTKDSYLCPVYKISTRQGTLSTTGLSTNFVVGMNLPTLRPAELFIGMGCAALLNLDD